MTPWKEADREAWGRWLSRCRGHQAALGIPDEGWQRTALEVSAGRTNHTALLTEGECVEFERALTREHAS